MTAATTVPMSSNRAYPMRLAVEFLHDGQQAQHRLHAADPKQQATCKQNKLQTLESELKREKINKYVHIYIRAVP